MRNAITAEIVINNAEIYRGCNFIGRQLVEMGRTGPLFVLTVPSPTIASPEIRRSGKIRDTQTVHVIGHPVGLPTKFAGGASVRRQPAKRIFCG